MTKTPFTEALNAEVCKYAHQSSIHIYIYRERERLKTNLTHVYNTIVSVQHASKPFYVLVTAAGFASLACILV